MAWREGGLHVTPLATPACLAFVLVLAFSCPFLTEAAVEKHEPLTRQGAALVSNMISADLERTVDPMGIKLSRQEKITMGEVQRYEARRRSASRALWGLLASFSATFLAGAITLGRKSASERSKHMGVAAIAVAIVSILGMLPAGVIHDAAEMSVARHRKDLKALFEKRLEREKNEELKSRLSKRRVIVEDGKLVGSEKERYNFGDLIGKLTATPDVM